MAVATEIDGIDAELMRIVSVGGRELLLIGALLGLAVGATVAIVGVLGVGALEVGALLGADDFGIFTQPEKVYGDP